MDLLTAHREEVLACRQCPKMVGPVVVGPPIASKIFLLGQAPGPHEGRLGRPFAWTAGRTLFGWFERLGIDEDSFRQQIYMAAVCRCFPGKAKGGGDRVPSRIEISNCSTWLRAEIEILQPELVVPVGRLAISQLMEIGRLVDVVGQTHRIVFCGHETEAIPLPHPSGASTWHRTEPGRGLLDRALELIASHPAFRSTFRESA